MEIIISIFRRLADAGFVAKYPPRSHSHNIFSLLPQTEAQYRWLKSACGTTANVVLPYTAEEIKSAAPELAAYVRPTKSGRFCRIEIRL